MSPRTFDKWGYALWRKYGDAVAPFLTAREGKLRHLDWGRGAGRMARYLAGECDYRGIDIDREAIDWWRKNIPDGACSLQGLAARTEFAADTFDAAIGISIFTHLKETGHGVPAAEEIGGAPVIGARPPPRIPRSNPNSVARTTCFRTANS
jgi:hypothetical protein